MEDNALQPNTPQPLQGNEGVPSADTVPLERQSAMESFLSHFGVRNKDASEQTTTQAPSDFASRLNGIDSQPPSMDGADVVNGPNLQPPTPSQEEPQVQASDLGGSIAPSIGEQTIGVDSSSAETPSPMGTPNMDTTPDLAGLAINTPAPDVDQPVGGDPSPLIEQATLPEDAKKQLVSAKENLQQALAAIDKLLGTNLADAPVDITAGLTPKEPVGVGS